MTAIGVSHYANYVRAFMCVHGMDESMVTFVGLEYLRTSPSQAHAARPHEQEKNSLIKKCVCVPNAWYVCIVGDPFA